MPNIWAHIQFGREMLPALDADIAACMTSDGAWKRAFQFGCQGPDFLFYHRFFPWQSKSAAIRLGSRMHNEHCGPFLLSLLEQVRGKPFTNPVFAYAFGFLLHHILDRNMHPFVFSRSGFRKWRHQQYETAMDAVIMQRRADIHTGKVPAAPEIDTGGRIPGGFTADFHRIVQAHYPLLAKEVTPQVLDEAVRDMFRAQRLFYDPHGLKGKLLFGQIAPFSPPRRLPAWDVLNDAHAPWIDPTDRTRRLTASADDLWEAAIEDGRRTGGAALSWLRAELSGGAGSQEGRPNADSLRKIFAEALGNVSYETGRPCGSVQITYAEPVAQLG